MGASLQWFVAEQRKGLISAGWLLGGTEQPHSGAGTEGSLEKLQAGMSFSVSSPGQDHVWVHGITDQELQPLFAAGPAVCQVFSSLLEKLQHCLLSTAESGHEIQHSAITSRGRSGKQSQEERPEEIAFINCVDAELFFSTCCVVTGEGQSSEQSSGLFSNKRICTCALPGASLWDY